MTKSILSLFVIVLMAMSAAVQAGEKIPVTTDDARAATYRYSQPQQNDSVDNGQPQNTQASSSFEQAPQDITPAAGGNDNVTEAETSNNLSKKSAPLTTDEARGATY